MSRLRWNHNIHYHRIVLEAIPDDAVSALDVGTGDGLLARDLAHKVPDVTAIDLDRDVVDSARAEFSGINFLIGDVMTYDFRRKFDVVGSVATLHHLANLPAALRHLAGLTAPGGVLVVVGLARPTRLSDFAMDAVGVIQHRWLSWRRGLWEHSAPTVWPLPHSYAQVRQAAAAELPGVAWRKLPLFRYALVWYKPER
ncbi:class I SAM-dependent methyltransferase [Williamsia limnetica]|uniref:class I SAM-dependent methyltransferase n=1 Tax=Williamsia limnetica TaxID=882452 RepID=UPI000D7C26D9|nr:class I SAM-dependent methyltransferase [Williamsia limnetica]